MVTSSYHKNGHITINLLIKLTKLLFPFLLLVDNLSAVVYYHD